MAPENFQGTILALQFDLWLPATLAPALFAGSTELDDRSQRGYSAMGRLRDGATKRRPPASWSAMSELAARFPESNGRISGELMPYWRAPRGPQMMFITALGILQGVMLLVLLAGLRQHRQPGARARQHAAIAKSACGSRLAPARAT